MARSKKFVVAGVAAGMIPRGTPTALFFRGVDRFADARGTIEIEGSDGEKVEACVVNAEAGRLFDLANRFAGQSVYAQAGPAPIAGYTGAYTPGMVVGGGNGATALFDALEDEGDPAALAVTEPYTVVVVQLPVPVPTALGA
ncbi:hypothetical protein [Methylobacterium oxalidis]|uniref:hypothetical protein n=1 Tax=Methylobacterium oxalidis TaxID=944322 RepID=UPI003314DBF4